MTEPLKTIHARGTRIPARGFGTWQLEGRTCTERVAGALAIGYRHIDTARGRATTKRWAPA